MLARKILIEFLTIKIGTTPKKNIMLDGFFFRNLRSLLDEAERRLQRSWMIPQALCAAVYRIRSPAWGTAALNHFHAPQSIDHAVVGGHGSDSTMSLGYILASRNGDGKRVFLGHHRLESIFDNPSMIVIIGVPNFDSYRDADGKNS